MKNTSGVERRSSYTLYLAKCLLNMSLKLREDTGPSGKNWALVKKKPRSEWIRATWRLERARGESWKGFGQKKWSPSVDISKRNELRWNGFLVIRFFLIKHPYPYISRLFDIHSVKIMKISWVDWENIPWSMIYLSSEILCVLYQG
jgi:hypothetical protein